MMLCWRPIRSGIIGDVLSKGEEGTLVQDNGGENEAASGKTEECSDI